VRAFEAFDLAAVLRYAGWPATGDRTMALRHLSLGIASLGVAAFAALAPVSASAQGAAPPVKPEMNESCPGFVATDRPRIVPAAFRLAALQEGEVRISYVGHSTFLIESPRLVRIATDFNDYVKPPVLPDIVTMNHAHSTHYTDRPDPGIKFVLRGWRDDGKPTDWDVQYQDVRVRSVATNIRDWNGGTQRHGNSIFIFEVANLCIAHLGHLHHTLTQQQLNEIGRIDAVLVPVDGSYTLDLEGMIEVLTSLKAPMMIPMHYFSSYTLNRFIERIKKDWDVEFAEVPSVVLSKHTLPTKPKLLVLPGR
jgi:L-ascorbate metabolism protein UlaG (beta-lactamase superfamily)